MICHVKCILKIRDGKYVTVRKHCNEMKLYAVDQQGDEDVAHIWYDRKRNHISFCCQQGGHYYFPKVVGDNLMVEKVDRCDLPLPKSHCFEKVDQGLSEFYSLRSVDPPFLYLSISDDKLSISAQENMVVEVTDEMQETSS